MKESQSRDGELQKGIIIKAGFIIWYIFLLWLFVVIPLQRVEYDSVLSADWETFTQRYTGILSD